MNKRQRKKRGKRVQVTEGSGNVFADLGLPNPEARLAEAKLRARRTMSRAERLRQKS